MLVDGGGLAHAGCLAHVFRVATGRAGRHRSDYSARLPSYPSGPEYLNRNEVHDHQICDGTNQIQRMVMARQFLK